MEEIDREMTKPGFWDNHERASAVSKERDALHEEVMAWDALTRDLEAALEIAHVDKGDTSVSLRGELEAQLKELETRFERLEFARLLSEPYDARGVILHVQAGAGGVDAMDWAAMLVRMYARFFERQGWKARLVHESRGEEAGLKSATLLIEGRYAYGYLKGEHGIHRLVRVSPFDAASMRHTSFAAVEVTPFLEEINEITIDPKDIHMDTFLASGKGGQYVQKTESAVRLTHTPTGIAVTCQSERNQHQNRDTAMRMLAAKLLQRTLEARETELAQVRGERKSVAWGNQIRSYVLHPYHQVKDHRTGLEVNDPERVLAGDLLEFAESYLKWKAAQG